MSDEMASVKKQLWLCKPSMRWPRLTPETIRLGSKSFQIIAVKVYVHCVQCTNDVGVGQQVVQLNSERLCLDVQRLENDFNQDCDAVSYKGQSSSFFLVLFTCPFPKLYWFINPVKNNLQS